MNILVLNCGSSSLKYKLFDMPEATVAAAGLVERIGSEKARIRHQRARDGEMEEVFHKETPIRGHEEALRLAAELLVDPEIGVLDSALDIHGVGHRIVHGGEAFNQPSIIDDGVLREIEANVSLAPLHNPAGLAGIRVAAQLFSHAPMVAVFDTAFHQTMPDHAYMFPIPYELYEKQRIRRYGFHGASHSYVARETARAIGREPEDASVITVHLGNGCSMAAVRRGRCVDTSMGLTPLMGLMMGTRSGDVDPALPVFLANNLGLDIDGVDALLNKNSGLKGVCGLNDMRDIHAARTRGDCRACLALRMFAYRVKSYIGSYLAILGGCHAIAFTAGIGENDHEVRALACEALEHLGVELDPRLNREAPRGRIAVISRSSSPVRVLVVPTNEELEIATQTHALLAEPHSASEPRAEPHADHLNA